MKQYKDKRWLENKYWKEELSQQQIARLCKVDVSTIKYWFIKLNIPHRSLSETNHLSQANHCHLSQRAIEWISGELLGDGCLSSQSRYSASFKYSSKYLEYIKYISNTLRSFGIEQAGKIRKRYDERFNRTYYLYSSLHYVELLPIWEQWYPEGKKIVPKNVILNPLIVRQWYIGDGSLRCRRKRIKKGPRIELATNGFTITDVKWLIKELIKLGFRATRWSFSNEIGISTYSTKAFLEYIGSCPVECYQYKWNYQDNGRILA